MNRPIAAILSSLLLLGTLIESACSSDDPRTPAPPTSATSVAPIDTPPPTETVAPTETATPTKTPTRTETPQPTPSPRPIDPTQANASYRNGEYELAGKEFAKLAETTTGSERAKAMLGQARAQIAAGDIAGAAKALKMLTASGPDAATALAALYLSARLHLEAEEYELAADEFVRYAEQHGPAAIYARQDAATAFALAGDDGPAQRQLELAVAVGPGPRQLPLLLLALGQSYERTKAWAKAGATFGRLEAESDSSADAALALFHLGEIALKQGDRWGWRDALTRVMRLYPEAPAASDALTALQEAREKPDPVLAGTVYYKSFRDEEAVKTLEGFFDTDPVPGAATQQAAYYRATALERLGRLRESIEWYRRADEYAPAGEFAHKAVWWGAVNADAVGDFATAEAGYTALLDRFPDSPFAAEAGFKLALNQYRRGAYARAAKLFAGEATLQTSDLRSRALLWQGKALHAAGDATAAAAAWQQAVEGGDNDYFQLRAELLLAGKDQEPTLRSGAWVVPSEPPEPQWDQIDAWVARFAGLKPTTALPTAGDRWRRALAIRDLGEERRAFDELHALLNDVQLEPWFLLDAVRGFEREGITHLAAIGAARLYLQAPASLQDSIPVDLYRIAFPVDYLPLVQTITGAEGMDPLLLYALVRQESFFDPAAESGAGALGLTQVIPSTGADIAERLGVEAFEPRLLLRPVVSLRFGAYYIARQLEAFGGSPYFALAAYNAGPGNASRWSDKGRVVDIDLFLEQIDVDEPKLYIRYVLQNYARYRALYLDAGRFSLAESP